MFCGLIPHYIVRGKKFAIYHCIEACTNTGLYWEESELILILRKNLKSWVSVGGVKWPKVKFW